MKLSSLWLSVAVAILVSRVVCSEFDSSIGRPVEDNRTAELEPETMEELSLSSPDWQSFKAEFGKNYSSLEEETLRFELFAKKKLKIDKFNREQSKEAGYTLGLNAMSDWTEEEFAQLLMPALSSEEIEAQQSSGKIDYFLREILDRNEPVPSSIDWRGTKRVTSVKNQAKYGKDCGSCWAFATVGVLEGQEYRFSEINAPISLSPQHIMDCGTYGYDPCRGSYLPTQPLDDVSLMGGVQSEEDYPYLADKSTCRTGESPVVIKNEGAQLLPAERVDIMEKVVARYGPIYVEFTLPKENSHFESHKWGVFSSRDCYDKMLKQGRHAVVIVGYGTDPEMGDYWIIVSRQHD